jgi:uncharacterized protein (TIGR03435 family)
MKLPAALLLTLFGFQLHAQQFDVASVKANKSDDPPFANMPLGPGAVFSPTGGLFSARGFPLTTYIAFAWKIGGTDFEYLFRQLPQWALTDRFDIEARAAGNPDKDTFRLMIRALLSERFKLALRYDEREIPVSAMVLATPGKTGPQLRLHTDGAECPTNDLPPTATSVPTVTGGYPTICGGIFGMPPDKPSDQRIAARDITMAFLARSLPFTETNRPMVDRTGLTGTIDFVLEWFPVRPGRATSEPDPDQSGPPFAEALRKQLGIRLESTKAPMDVLVLDHIEHLIEN